MARPTVEYLSAIEDEESVDLVPGEEANRGEIPNGSRHSGLRHGLSISGAKGPFVSTDAAHLNNLPSPAVRGHGYWVAEDVTTQNTAVLHPYLETRGRHRGALRRKTEPPTGWQRHFTGLFSADNENYTLAVAQDRLYIGGPYVPGGEEVTSPRAVRWNGSAYTALPDLGEPVQCWEEWESAAVAGGEFPTGPVQMLSEGNWQTLGDLRGIVYALEVHDGDLYAGGLFHAGDRPGRTQLADRALRLVAGQFFEAASGLAGPLKLVKVLMATDDPEEKPDPILFAIERTPGSGDRVVRWDPETSTWIFVALTPGPATSLAIFDATRLVVGGRFDGGVRLIDLADNNAVSEIPGGGLSGEDLAVQALISWEGKIYAAGRFTQAGSIAVKNIASWNDTAGWEALEGGLGYSGADPISIDVMLVWQDALYIGGRFDEVDGVAVPAGAEHIAAWDGTSWATLPTTDSPTGRVRDLVEFEAELWCVHDGSEIVASFDGSAWSSEQHNLANQALSGATRLLVHDGQMHIAGKFSMTIPADPGPEQTLNRIATLSGSEWVRVAGGLPGPRQGQLTTSSVRLDRSSGVISMASFGGDLWIGIAIREPLPSGNVAKYDQISDTWSLVGGGTNGVVRALRSFGGLLYAGGRFSYAGTTYAPNLAAWDGEDWQSVAGGRNANDEEQGGVHAIVTRQLELFVGGQWANWSSVLRVAGGELYDVLSSATFGDALGALTAMGIAGGVIYAAFVFPGDFFLTDPQLQLWSVVPGTQLVFSKELYSYQRIQAIAGYGAQLIIGGSMRLTEQVIPGEPFTEKLQFIASFQAPTGLGAIGAGLDGRCLAARQIGGDLYIGGEFGAAFNPVDPPDDPPTRIWTIDSADSPPMPHAPTPGYPASLTAIGSEIYATMQENGSAFVPHRLNIQSWTPVGFDQFNQDFTAGALAFGFAGRANFSGNPNSQAPDRISYYSAQHERWISYYVGPIPMGGIPAPMPNGVDFVAFERQALAARVWKGPGVVNEVSGRHSASGTTTWSSPLQTGRINSAVTIGDYVYIGGQFENLNLDFPNVVNGIARSQDAQAWEALPEQIDENTEITEIDVPWEVYHLLADGDYLYALWTGNRVSRFHLTNETWEHFAIGLWDDALLEAKPPFNLPAPIDPVDPFVTAPNRAPSTIAIFDDHLWIVGGFTCGTVPRLFGIAKLPIG